MGMGADGARDTGMGLEYRFWFWFELDDLVFFGIFTGMEQTNTEEKRNKDVKKRTRCGSQKVRSGPVRSEAETNEISIRSVVGE